MLQSARMLDYDDLDALEGYALAAGTQERRQLLAASAPGASGVTAGQVFLAGTFVEGLQQRTSYSTWEV